MFEDSLMESGGKIKTKSKYWMIGTFAFNGVILATMILIPLLYPEALPKTAMTAMLTAPPPTTSATSATSAAADREADQDGVGDRSGPACADEDSQRHQDAEGRCCASSDDGWRRRYERHGQRTRRSGRRDGWHWQRADTGGEGCSTERSERVSSGVMPGAKISERRRSIRRLPRRPTSPVRSCCTPSSRRRARSRI